MAAKDAKRSGRQLLHLVFGGELKSLDRTEFSNLKGLDIVGIYPNYAQAYKAWKAAAQRPYALFHRPSASLARSGARQRR